MRNNASLGDNELNQLKFEQNLLFCFVETYIDVEGTIFLVQIVRSWNLILTSGNCILEPILYIPINLDITRFDCLI